MDDFAIFILTHGRADDQKSYSTFRKCGYTGKIYLVVDDLDEQLPLYKEKYGNEVIVFDKKKYWKKTDTFMNTENMLAVVFARNACFDLAKQKKLKYFVNCDDDIKSLAIKMPQPDGSLKSTPLKNMDKMLSAYRAFMEETNIEATSICEEGAYIGGANKNILSGRYWSFAHFFMINASTKLRFRGLYDEDVIFAVSNQTIGKKIYCPVFIAQSLPDRKKDKQTGGMVANYNSVNGYVTAFMTVIANPGCMYLYTKNGVLKGSRKTNSIIPKILNEKYRK